jgi:arylsulfatase A-like enzyme
MRHRMFTAAALLASTPAGARAQQQPPARARTAPPDTNVVLPPPDFHFKGTVGRTIGESDPPEFPGIARPPAGAPNVVIILIDDVGYGQFSTFGGQTPTPALDRLAAEGLRYTQFHTTALCSPTRAALLTGRNHHAAGTGMITEAATGYDGYTGIIPRSAGTVAEVLRQNGYATAWFGKNHNTPDWETSQNGPFDHWPSGYGFDYFYGFMGGDVDQYQPTLYENNNLVPRSADPAYTLTADLTDHAIRWLRMVRAIDPAKPYLLYMAPGATHAPHQVPADWIARFRGQFDQGWDVYRQQTLERQKRLGVVPADAELTPRPASLPAWASLSADQKRLYARMMEVFAAFTAQTDYEMGRLLDAVRAQPDADNTLVFYIVGDNGSSAEGGLVGLLNENSYFNNVPETLADNLAHIDELGGPKHFNHFPAGWAWAMDTPFQWTKQIASHLGGVRNPLVVSWPARIRDRGGVRGQFGHVIDVAPTIYEATGIRPPTELNGTPQKPLEGVSMAYTFDSAQAAGRHRTQYFEMMVNRAIYNDGWWAAARAGIPWDASPAPVDPDTLRWELYDLTRDFSQAHDLSAQEPMKLRQLQELWWAEAARHDVLPLDGRKVERLNAELQGRPTPTAGRTTFTYYPGVAALPAGSAPNLLNKSWTVTAELEIPKGQVNGVVWAMGALDGGFALYVRNGLPVFAGNFLGRTMSRASGTTVLPQGKVSLRGEFAYDGGGLGKGATLTVFVNGRKAGTARMERTVPLTLGLGGTLDVGLDTGSPADDAYQAQAPFPFTGTIDRVTIRLGPPPS